MPELARFESFSPSHSPFIYFGGSEIASLHPLVSELGSRTLISSKLVCQPKVSGLRLPFVPESNLLSPCLNLVLDEGLRERGAM